MLNGDGTENGIKINRSNWQKTKFLHVQDTFLSFFAVVLHDYNAVLYDQNVKLPSYTLFS